MSASISTRTPHQPARLTLPVAYASFIVLGMVSSLAGVAWPSIRATFALPLDALGLFLLTNTAGYLLASVISGRLTALMQTGTLLAGCCALATLALLGIGVAPTWAVVVALGLLTGSGGGALDSTMNAYAATSFSPRALNWLHACYGMGSTLGPIVMTTSITSGLGWRVGYLIVAAIQLTIAAAFVLTRGIWHQPASVDAQLTPGVPLMATICLPMAWLGIGLFFVSVGIGATTGNWAFSLLTESRGVSPSLAGTAVSVYWGSLTIGRILFGIVVSRVASSTLLRCCMVAALLSALLIWLHSALWLTLAGIALMGLALAPQFPLLIAATPMYLGPRHANNGVGFQVAAASLGGALLPSLVGVLARSRGLEVLGPFLFVAALGLTVLFEILVRRLPQEGTSETA